MPVSNTQIYVQAGAFSRYDNANKVLHRLRNNVGKPKMTSVIRNGVELFRVRMGPIASVDHADAVLKKVISVGYPDARIVVE